MLAKNCSARNSMAPAIFFCTFAFFFFNFFQHNCRGSISMIHIASAKNSFLFFASAQSNSDSFATGTTIPNCGYTLASTTTTSVVCYIVFFPFFLDKLWP